MTSAVPRKPGVPTKLAHFVLRTRRYAELIAWYETVLQSRIVLGNPFISFLTFDDEHHRIAIVNNGSLVERPLHAVGLDHVAFTYASLGDLLGNYERLKAAGITPATCIHHGPTVSMYYLDPDLNQVEFQVDAFDSVEELNGYFATEASAKNPIGVLYDPDDLLKRWKEGVPERELRRPIAGPLPPFSAFPAH